MKIRVALGHKSAVVRWHSRTEKCLLQPAGFSEDSVGFIMAALWVIVARFGSKQDDSRISGNHVV